MQIESERQGAVTVLKPRGPLVAEDADALRLRGSDTIAASLGRMGSEAAACVFVARRGIESPLARADERADAGRVLKLCGVNETVREVLELTETGGAFEHYEDVTAAVRSFL